MTPTREDLTIIRPLAAFHLVVRAPSGQSLRVPLAPGVLTIGRDTACGLVLDPADVSVSRRHASLTVDGQTVTVADCGSTNGVFVGGTKVERAALVPGDQVRLGQTVLVLESAGPAVAPPHAATGAGSAAPGRGPVSHRLRQRPLLAAAVLAVLFLVLGLALFFRSQRAAPVAPSPGQETKADGTPAPPTAQPASPRQSDAPAASAEAVEKAEDLTRQGLFFYNNGNIAAASGEWEKALALDPQNAQAAKWLARAEGERDQLLDKYYREGITALKYARADEAKAAFRYVMEHCRSQSADERCQDAARQLGQLEGKTP